MVEYNNRCGFWLGCAATKCRHASVDGTSYKACHTSNHALPPRVRGRWCAWPAFAAEGLSLAGARPWAARHAWRPRPPAGTRRAWTVRRS